MSKLLLINRTPKRLIDTSIVFYCLPYSNGSGSVYMRGCQVCYELKNHYNCCCSNDMNNIKNSIVIFIKDWYNLNAELLKKSKENNNINVIDIIDYMDAKTPDQSVYGSPDFLENGFNKYVDAYIVNNKIMEEEYTKKYNKFSFVIPHHWDPRISDLQKTESSELKFLFNGYIGHTNVNCLYIDKLRNDLPNFYYSDSFENFMRSPHIHDCCHINVRKEGSWEYETKPLMKLSHASSVNCNIITTNDYSIRDLLPQDYPYLLKDDKYETLIEMIEYVKQTYKTPVWYKGLEMIAEIKNKLCIQNNVKDYYCKFIEELHKRYE